MKKVTLKNYRQDTYYPRVVQAVDTIIREGREVAPVDIFLKMGLLLPRDLENWRRGRVPYLEKVIRCNLSKANRVLRIFGFHAHDLNLQPATRAYRHKSHQLRFSKTRDPNIEQAYACHFRKIEKEV